MEYSIPHHKAQLQALQTDSQLAQLQASQTDSRCHDKLLCDALVALLGEGVAVPRVPRQWAHPQQTYGRCPGCERTLRLLAVPSLDVMQCVYCSTAFFACVSCTAQLLPITAEDRSGGCALSSRDAVLPAPARACSPSMIALDLLPVLDLDVATAVAEVVTDVQFGLGCV